MQRANNDLQTLGHDLIAGWCMSEIISTTAPAMPSLATRIAEIGSNVICREEIDAGAHALFAVTH